MTTGLFFFFFSFGSLSHSVPLRQSPWLLLPLAPPPLGPPLHPGDKKIGRGKEEERGPGQPSQVQLRSRTSTGPGLVVVVKGGALSGQVKKKPSTPPQPPPSPPPQIGFAVLHARGHLYLLSSQQAPDTLLSALHSYSHIILAATL